MPGPASAGLLIHAKHPDRLALFYMEVLGMQLQHHTAERIVLQAPELQMVLQALPEAQARRLAIAEPPLPRRNVAIAFFATVVSFGVVRPIVAAHGGQLWDEVWQGPDFRMCHAMDPEGNLFELREPLTA